MSSIVHIPEGFLWPVPDQWSLKEAASVPMVYATAYYALIFKAGIKKGEKVLINSGCSLLGQAAIYISLSYGCDVYATVESKIEEEFLNKNTVLPSSHIFNTKGLCLKYQNKFRIKKEREILKKQVPLYRHVQLAHWNQRKIFRYHL